MYLLEVDLLYSIAAAVRIITMRRSRHMCHVGHLVFLEDTLSDNHVVVFANGWWFDRQRWHEVGGVARANRVLVLCSFTLLLALAAQQITSNLRIPHFLHFFCLMTLALLLRIFLGLLLFEGIGRCNRIWSIVDVLARVMHSKLRALFGMIERIIDNFVRFEANALTHSLAFTAGRHEAGVLGLFSGAKVSVESVWYLAVGNWAHRLIKLIVESWIHLVFFETRSFVWWTHLMSQIMRDTVLQRKLSFNDPQVWNNWLRFLILLIEYF